MKRIEILIILFLITFGCGNALAQNPENNRFRFLLEEDTLPFKKEKPASVYNDFWVCLRANYMMGKFNYAGGSVPFLWVSKGYGIPVQHIGFSVGFDVKTSGSERVYAPKVAFEYRLLLLVARTGYHYYSDFRSRSEHRLFAEVGLSALGFLDVTYVHSFGLNGDPFGLGASHLNITATIPIPSRVWTSGSLWKE